MKHIDLIFFFFLTFFVSFSFGQNTNTGKSKTVFAAKVYAVSSFENTSSILTLANQVSIFKSFSPTISWGKEYGNFNEVEMTDLKFVNYKADGRRFEIGSRYSYNWRLAKNKLDTRFSYYLGAGVDAYFKTYKSYYKIDRSRGNEYDMNVVLIPRINYKLGERMYLDLNIPLKIFNTSRFNSNVTEGSYNEFLPARFTVNIGVAIKF